MCVVGGDLPGPSAGTLLIGKHTLVGLLAQFEGNVE